jgi:hypothetical protein
MISTIEERAEALCADPLFRQWLGAIYADELDPVQTQIDAERGVSVLCGVLHLEDLEESEARALFAERISGPFLRWKRSADRALPMPVSIARPCTYAKFCPARIRAGDYPGGCNVKALRTCATGLLIRMDWKVNQVSFLAAADATH